MKYMFTYMYGLKYVPVYIAHTETNNLKKERFETFGSVNIDY